MKGIYFNPRRKNAASPAMLTLPRDAAEEKHFSLSRCGPRGMLPPQLAVAAIGHGRNDPRMTAATVRRLSIPTPDDLIERARAMVPEIRELAEATEQYRNE